MMGPIAHRGPDLRRTSVALHRQSLLARRRRSSRRGGMLLFGSAGSTLGAGARLRRSALAAQR